jgi:hypothetical protein
MAGLEIGRHLMLRLDGLEIGAVLDGHGEAGSL